MVGWPASHNTKKLQHDFTYKGYWLIVHTAAVWCSLFSAFSDKIDKYFQELSRRFIFSILLT